MKGICVISAALALSTSPALAADQTIPLATMTCRQFVDSPKDTIGVTDMDDGLSAGFG